MRPHMPIVDPGNLISVRSVVGGISPGFVVAAATSMALSVPTIAMAEVVDKVASPQVMWWQATVLATATAVAGLFGRVVLGLMFLLGAWLAWGIVDLLLDPVLSDAIHHELGGAYRCTAFGSVILMLLGATAGVLVARWRKTCRGGLPAKGGRVP